MTPMLSAPGSSLNQLAVSTRKKMVAAKGKIDLPRLPPIELAKL